MGSNSGIAMRPLRAYLLALAVGVVLPLVALAALQAVDGAALQRKVMQAALVETSHALATSVEHELLRSVAALNVLAASPRLAARDLEGFREEARAAMRESPWYTVWVADTQGQQLMNLLVAPGDKLPSLSDRPYVVEALRTGHWAVSGLVQGRVTGRLNATLVVPLMQDGKPRFLIGAALRPGVLDEILSAVNQRLRTATASIVDRDYIIIARNRDAARWVGQRANESYIASLSDAPEGLARSRIMEGDPVYVAYRRLPASGWTVGMGVLASEVDEPLRRALWTTGLGGLFALLLAGLLAVLLSRRITVPMKALAETAQGIAIGHDGPVPEGSGIAEIATLARALAFAAEASHERKQLAEQARCITAELEAAEILERQQIARDLHDDLAQTLAAAQIRLAGLEAHGDQEVARAARELSLLIGRANHSTRAVAQQLSPPVLYELGLVPALEWMAQQLEVDFGLHVQVQDDGEPKPLSTEAASIVFRGVRELLINVAKHAQTRSATVSLAVVGERELLIQVVDAGRGIDPSVAAGRIAKGRLGLRGVKERLAHLGGSFDIAPLRSGGSRATLRVPLDGPPAHGD
jgi:signal transduction histidine kinase